MSKLKKESKIIGKKNFSKINNFDSFKFSARFSLFCFSFLIILILFLSIVNIYFLVNISFDSDLSKFYFSGDKLSDSYTIIEKIHLVDVKILSLKSLIFNLLGFSFILSVFSLFKFKFKKDYILYFKSKIFKRYLLFSSIIILLFLSLFLIFFNYFFILFHEIFFNNDFWILPFDSLLILNYPESFFVKSIIYIFSIFIFLISLFYFLFFNSEKILKNH